MAKKFNEQPAQQQFKQQLAKRREELPHVLAELNNQHDCITVLSVMPNNSLDRLPLHDLAQFHSVKVPEITSVEMIETCLEITKHALRLTNRKNLTSEQIDILKEQRTRLKELKRAKEKGNDILHSFTEIIDNLQIIDPTCTRQLLQALQHVNELAIAETKATIENYAKLTL